MSSPGRLASAEQGQEGSLGTRRVFERRPELRKGAKKNNQVIKVDFKPVPERSEWTLWSKEQKINLVQN